MSNFGIQVHIILALSASIYRLLPVGRQLLVQFQAVPALNRAASSTLVVQVMTLFANRVLFFALVGNEAAGDSCDAAVLVMARHFR